MKNISPNHKLVPALVIDMKSFVEKENIDGIDKFSLVSEDMEKFFGYYHSKNYIICAIFEDNSVVNGERLPHDIDNDTNAIINLFKKNPFHIIKCCLHGIGGVEPYCHKSMMQFPNPGMFAIIEYDAFNMMRVIDWNNSLVVGKDDSNVEAMAKKVELQFKSFDDFCSDTHISIEQAVNTECQTFAELLDRYVQRFAKFDLTGLTKEKFKIHCHSITQSGGITMRIRNELGLWLNDKEHILKLFKEGGIEYGHPDDMSAEFLGKIYDKLKSASDGGNDNTNV